jgi:tetraacyldisaccharide 4'-kinase
VIVADDGLQHRQLRRDVEVIVFDERGLGNGLLLPAGPLREPFTDSRRPPSALVLYNHAHQHALARRLRAAAASAAPGPWPRGWGQASPQRRCIALRGRRLLAMAGIAVPGRFFAALRAAGLDIDALPMPDHHPYDEPRPGRRARARS